MEIAFSKGVEEVQSFLGVDLQNGLSDCDVAKARATYGRNELQPDEGTPLWRLVLRQFDDLLVKILLAAAVIDFAIAITGGEGFFAAMLEPSVIILILIANATVGVVTERNAEKAIEELKAYEAEHASVVRNGRLQQVPAADLVPGDVVEVAVGQKVPADIRLAVVYGNRLKVDQALLTGESNSVEKSTQRVVDSKAVLQDKVNMLFSGTMVTSGRGRGIVVGTGSSTAIGRIRDAMADQPEVLTPLKQKLDEFGTLLSKVIAVICVLVWIMNINRFWDPALGGWLQGAIYYFKIAVALAVAAIPEGLPAVVTTCLALGTRKMAKENAIVRSLPSVETLGCTTVICTDKTGTLTTNMMSIVRVAVVNSVASGNTIQEYEVTGNTYSPRGEVLGPGHAVISQPTKLPCLLQLAQCAAVCNDSSLAHDPISDTYSRIGESTEVALRVFVEKLGLPDMWHAEHEKGTPCNSHWQTSFPRTACLEFSRDRKMMSVLSGPEGRQLLFCKGAPEAVLQCCTSTLTNCEGVVPLSADVRAQLNIQLEVYGRGMALRCLALAYKNVVNTTHEVTSADESGLTFIGLIGMHDPPRLECRAAIDTCRKAGIRVVMVTGDNLATAEAVCRQVGAVNGTVEPGMSFTGAEFDELNEHHQASAAGTMVVFSRVEPLHKLRVVELLQAQGHVVAMTGDGVNDAPALMKADIGIAMGSGTAVAKQAADMVLADDNFATIVTAVAEGRAIYNNTKQFIRYMISSNIGEVVAIFVAALLGMPEVLSPVQLLWVNLVTDGLPATALGLNKPDPNIMVTSPRRLDEPIVNGWLFTRYLIIGVYVGLVTVGGFMWWFLGYAQGPRLSWRALTSYQSCSEQVAQAAGYSCAVFADKSPKTVSMSVLVVVEMFNALNNLSENASLLEMPPWANGWLLGAITTSMLLHFFILYFPPMAAMFSVTPLDSSEWLAVVALSAPVILVDEVLKFVSRRRRSRSLGSRGIELMNVCVDHTKEGPSNAKCC